MRLVFGRAIDDALRDLNPVPAPVAAPSDALDEVWRRLADDAVLERSDLRESLAQMRRGDGIPTDIDGLERDLQCGM